MTKNFAEYALSCLQNYTMETKIFFRHTIQLILIIVQNVTCKYT